ncbi:MAG: hypothetical protein ISS79_02255 [Phycisphaerae bacterium]|nr:hypothetical protein [Phycisphaerae bacterium]
MRNETKNTTTSHAQLWCRSKGHRPGSAYLLAATSVLVLTILGVGMLMAAWQGRHAAIRFKSEGVSALAAEAGYEKAAYWMGQQQDMLSALANKAPGTSGSLTLPDSTCTYNIALHTFIGSRPIYKITSVGHSGRFSKTVEVLVLQAISGWDMGMCRVPLGRNSTTPVYFADGEVIDLPLHINDLQDSPDKSDIYIMGSPNFLQEVGMGEAQHTDAGADKYTGVISLFDGGVYFSQPDCRITDKPTITTKIARFRDSTKANFQLAPVATARTKVNNPAAAVQLEFFVTAAGVGKVRITNNCTVRGFKQSNDTRTLDYRIQPESDGTRYERYDIYAYHLMNEKAVITGERFSRNLTQTYVTQSIGGVKSEPGGQIFVDGNVIIGGDQTEHNGNQVVKGKMTVVATGNIWVADSITVDGARKANGLPSEDNPNVLGLIAQGVVKVVDPGMTDEDVGTVGFVPSEPDGFKYVPIGRPDGGGTWVWVRTKVKVGRRTTWKWVKEYQETPEYKRHLPDPMVVEAAITVGGGGWGAENVARRSGWKTYGGRKEATGDQDYLVVRGTLVEAIRGVVGLVGSDGFYKRYYLDARLLQGVLPGDIWLRSKYVPAPGGWQDYRSSGT